MEFHILLIDTAMQSRYTRLIIIKINKKNKYLMYLVASNFYEWAICNLDFYQQMF